MTRAQDLVDWLAGVLGTDSVTVLFDDVIGQDQLPGAVVRPLMPTAGDTLDETLVIEQYGVILEAQRTGASGTEVAQQLATMERALVLAAQGPLRSSTRWEHLTAEPIGSEPGRSGFSVKLWCRGA